MADTPPQPSRKPLGVLRGLAAALGVIIMVFSGGCALLIGTFGGFSSGDGPMVLGYLGPPFLIGLGIWWLAVKVGR